MGNNESLHFKGTIETIVAVSDFTHEPERIFELIEFLKQAEAGVKNFGNSTDKMAAQTNKMGGIVKGTVPTLTSFSQVVQDAPYGIRGVANNIQQLTMQFGYLSKRINRVWCMMQNTKRVDHVKFCRL